MVQLAMGEQFARFDPPWYLRVLGWSCAEDCLYQCTQRSEDNRAAAGKRKRKYFGRWGFVRVAGAQEFVSMVLSILNAASHVHQLLFAREPLCPPGHFMSVWLRLYPLLGINTWLWSAVYHARDTEWTEAMDYTFAFLMLLYGLWLALVRVFGEPVSDKRDSSRRRKIRIAAMGTVVGLLFATHVACIWSRMKYGWYFFVAAAAAGLSTVVWFVRLWRVRKLPHARHGAAALLLFHCAALLELYDVPPWRRLVDSHAVWHACTVPLSFWWYYFLHADAWSDTALKDV